MVPAGMKSPVPVGLVTLMEPLPRRTSPASTRRPLTLVRVPPFMSVRGPRKTPSASLKVRLPLVPMWMVPFTVTPEVEPSPMVMGPKAWVLNLPEMVLGSQKEPASAVTLQLKVCPVPKSRRVEVLAKRTAVPMMSMELPRSVMPLKTMPVPEGAMEPRSLRTMLPSMVPSPES
jgi:hypothetical protein